MAGMIGNASGDLLSDNMGLSRCPESSGMVLDYPSTTILCSLFTAMAFAIAVLVVVKYNYLQWWLGDDLGATQPRASWGIDIGDERLASISNSYWIMFFMACGVRGILESFLFGVNSIHHKEDPVAGLQFAAWSMHAVTDFLLTLALYHQYYHRSRGVTGDDEEEASDDGDNANSRKWLKFLTSPECLLVLLAFLHTLCAWFAVPNLPEGELQYEDPYWVLLVSIILQRLPLYYFVCMICLHTDLTLPYPAPTRRSRIVLFLGTIIDIPSVIPFHILSKYILSSAISWKPCPLHIFSWLDLTIILHGMALVHFLYFIQAEFIRVHEIEFYDCLQHYSGNPITDAE